MKKLLFSIVLLLTFMATEAKVIKVTLTDGNVKVFTSSELSAIDIQDDGTLVVTTFDGRQLPALSAGFDELTIGDEAVVSEVFADTLRFKIDADGIPVDLHTNRPIMKVNYVYPSCDPCGMPVTLSGTMLIPEEIWNGQCRSEGILMVNHYTKFNRKEAPTLENGELENMLLANPLYPRYIIVESDFYGFGATERFPQAFLQGMVNARSSLDGLLSARELLSAMGIDYGPLCFNIGYSSGGFDALAAQKLRDQEYANRISFDKTFSGGGPSDVREAYRQYVLTDSTAYNAVPLLLMVCTNETQQLGLDYADVFQPYISGRIGELILSKAYSSWPVCDSIGRDKKIHEILSATYCDLESPESQAMQQLFDTFSMTNDDWTPDATQRIFLFHSRGDDYVPIQSARPMVAFLKSKGLQPSIIPGRTSLQTNFVVRSMGHLKATLVYYVQTLAAIAAWPKMYTDGELNPMYQTLAGSDVDVVMLMRQLDAMGFDCRSLMTRVIATMAGAEGGEAVQFDPVMVALLVQQQLAKAGITEQELQEMSEDSGVDLVQLMTSFLAYLSEQPANDDADGGNDETPTEGSTVKPAPARHSVRLMQALDRSETPVGQNVRQLTDWLADFLK